MTSRSLALPLVLSLLTPGALGCGGSRVVVAPPDDGEVVLRVRVRDDLCPVGGCEGGDETPEAPPMCEVPGPDGLTVAQLTAGYRFMCALLSDGHVRCWGANHEYSLGNGETGRSATPVRVRNVEGARLIASGRMHSCAMTESGQVWCWGQNDWGALGTSDRRDPAGNLAVRVRRIRGATSLAVGSDHSCAVSARGQVHCWGKNQAGQLGDGTRELRTTPTPAQSIRATAVGAGGDSTCAVRTDGGVSCWGALTGTERPTSVGGLTQPAVSVAVGDESACARLADGTVWCWGSGTHGTLGPATMAASDDAVAVAGLPPARSVQMGSTYACAVDVQGLTWCWGGRESLQSENADPRQRGGLGVAIDVAVNDEAACGALAAGGVCCWGRNTSGQLGTQFHPFSNPAPEAEWPVPIEW